ncbi:MAG: hypothetical protein LBH40_00840 [Alphaproteobacteria bacterium]|jgi:hypothetical protein|nr:hypothetical protein [Alphaproteobacteria bacterium]
MKKLYLVILFVVLVFNNNLKAEDMFIPKHDVIDIKESQNTADNKNTNDSMLKLESDVKKLQSESSKLVAVETPKSQNKTENTLIPQTEVDKSQSETDNFSWQEEISKLNLEVEDLKDKVMQQDQEAKNLKDELSEYKRKEELDNTRALRIERLKNILAKPVFSSKEIEDTDFNYAYSAILLGNLDQARESLLKFLAKDVKNNPLYYKETAVEQQPSRELIKDPLNVEGKSTMTEGSVERNNSQPNAPVATQKVVDEDFLASYQRAIDKANFLLGEIYLIDIQPKESVPFLVEAYNKSKDPDVIMLSLIGITESFSILKRYPEACVSIQRIERTLAKIKEIDPEYELRPSDLSFIERIRDISNCNIQE